eukprot:1724474-Rhodomonas_salina.1
MLGRDRRCAVEAGAAAAADFCQRRSLFRTRLRRVPGPCLCLARVPDPCEREHESLSASMCLRRFEREHVSV